MDTLYRALLSDAAERRDIDPCPADTVCYADPSFDAVARWRNRTCAAPLAAGAACGYETREELKQLSNNAQWLHIVFQNAPGTTNKRQQPPAAHCATAAISLFFFAWRV